MTKTWICAICKQVFEYSVNQIPVNSELSANQYCTDCVMDIECVEADIEENIDTQ